MRAASVTTSDAIRLRGGYNVTLFSGVDPRPQLLEPNITPVLQPGQEAATAPGERFRTRITLSADPGDGDGRSTYPHHQQRATRRVWQLHSYGYILLLDAAPC